MSHVDDCIKQTESFEKIIKPFASDYVKSESGISSQDNTLQDSEL